MNAVAQQAKEIFVDLISRVPPEEWDQRLAAVCGDDESLRRRVEALLKAHREPDSFLEQPAIAREVERTFDQPLERPGAQIGPYKLLEQIGEGGFGVVYMAEQHEPVRRKVALKVLKPGMDSRQIVARFEAERQALALMDHPNIARVFDGGTTPSGRPYFVMELVKGAPITDYCDQHRLTPRQRLELFVAVCQAVQHAHQKGVIHRDIKPTNVLVALHDTQPVVKVIDFGVAKALAQELTDKTLFTGLAQMVGTPLYMSPEQAGQSGLDIDTRSDIYSLGVLLYELLTGTTPFEKSRFHQAAYDEIRRIIREEEPPKPSTRLSSSRHTPCAVAADGTRSVPTTSLASIAAVRSTEPAKLTKLIRDELDWIVMKALEKERDRRYETATALAADVQRYLNDEPVQACPPSHWYRFRKFARRNKSALATASAMGLALLLAVAALAASTVQIAREKRLTANALQAETRANDDLERTFKREQQDAYFHRISLAHGDLSTDNLGRALKLLEECPEDLREWEWHFLMRLSRVEPLVLSDDTEINGLAFSPDGDRLASAGGDGTIKILHGGTGEVLQTITNAHTTPVVSVVFHSGGQYLASVGADRRVKVWDLTTEQELFNAPCDATRKFGTAYTVAFSPGGRMLAAGSEGAVSVWDWKNRQLLHSLPGHGSIPIPVAFRRDGRHLATGTVLDGVKLWDPETGLLLGAIPAHRHPISALAFNPDGGWLASASFDTTVKVSVSTTGELIHKLEHPGLVLGVAFSPDGKRLASAGEDRTVRVWDATTGREVLALRGHTDRCGCVAFSPDGRRLASASTDGTIRIWDATPLRGAEGQEIRTFTRHSDEIRSVAFSPDDSRRIASAGMDGRVMVWDVPSGGVSVPFSDHRLVVFCVGWHPDGERIASSGFDGDRHSVKVWDARTGRVVFTIQTEREKLGVPFSALAFSPDGRHLVTGRVNGDVQVWEAGTGREVQTLDSHGGEIRGLAFSGEEGGRLASASSDGVVILWDATSLDMKQDALLLTDRARVPGPSLNVAFSPDGRRLATGGEDNTVWIWDVETGSELRTLRGHTGEVYSVAFSPDPDGRWIASGSGDSTVKVWDSRTGKLIRSFRGHRGIVSSVAFSPDGRRLVSGSRDKTVKIWDVTPGPPTIEVLP